MNNVIDIIPYIENKRALENLEKADIETKQALADGINSFSFQDEQFLREVVKENRKQLGMGKEQVKLAQTETKGD